MERQQPTLWKFRGAASEQREQARARDCGLHTQHCKHVVSTGGRLQRVRGRVKIKSALCADEAQARGEEVVRCAALRCGGWSLVASGARPAGGGVEGAPPHRHSGGRRET